MKVRVKAFATFREVMDSQIELELPEDATIRMLLAELTARYRDLRGMLFAGPEILKDFVNILRNGRNIQFLAGLDTPLGNGDVIALFPPVAGG